jgi:glycosyltransferase involved in cell wall biosynthesis
MRKLKILHLLSQRPDSTGSGIFVEAMIREAAALGHDNFLVAGLSSDDGQYPDCIEPDKSMFVHFPAAEVCYDIPGMSDVMPYESSRFCDLTEEQLYAYEQAFTNVVQKAVDRFKPDIIHSHHLWIVSSIARQLLPDIPLVTTCHGSDLRQFQNCPHLQGQVLAGCREIDIVMALTVAQKKQIVDLYKLAPENITVAGAGYDQSLFLPETKPEPDPVQLVYAGKLSKAKGVPWLLRALQSIKSPAWQLHLVGGGSGVEKEHCLKLAGESRTRVHVHGALPQENLARIVRQSHILVLPSFFEGLPLVILEALASGCRVVATDLPGTRAIIGRSQTELISLVSTPRLHSIDKPFPEDEHLFERELSNAIQLQINAVHDCAETDLTSIQERLDHYTWNSVFNRVTEVYMSCV